MVQCFQAGPECSEAGKRQSARGIEEGGGDGGADDGDPQKPQEH